MASGFCLQHCNNFFTYSGRFFSLGFLSRRMMPGIHRSLVSSLPNLYVRGCDSRFTSTESRMLPSNKVCGSFLWLLTGMGEVRVTSLLQRSSNDGKGTRSRCPERCAHGDRRVRRQPERPAAERAGGCGRARGSAARRCRAGRSRACRLRQRHPHRRARHVPGARGRRQGRVAGRDAGAHAQPAVWQRPTGDHLSRPDDHARRCGCSGGRRRREHEPQPLLGRRRCAGARA